MAQRNLRVDTLRGLACLLLVLYHVIGADTGSGLRVAEGEPLRVFNDCLAYVRMPLFSFLSGFVYAWRPFDGDAGKFVAGKARRLLVPMLLVGTFFAVLQANTPGVNHTAYDWGMLHIVPVAHFWFLESLFLVFMIVAMLESLGWLRREPALLAVGAATVALHLANPLPVWFGMLGAVYLLPFFLLGVWANRFGPRYPDSQALAVGAIVAVVAAALALWHHDPARNTISALALGGSLCIVLQRLRIQLPWLAWIGVHSFAIYMFHPVFSAATRIILDKAAEPDFADSVLLVVGWIAGVFGPIVTEAALCKFKPVGGWLLGSSQRTPASR